MNTIAALRRQGFGLAFSLAAVCVSPLASYGQATGRVVGRVLNGDTGEAVVGAQVYLSDQSALALSNLDGRYLLRNVAAGTHDVVVQSLGFATKTVTGVAVEDGGTTVIDITVMVDAVTLEGITISAEAEADTDVALLTERRSAPIAQDAIGAEQISRSPDGDAAAALKRVPGLTVIGGKYAYVRGLGERYSQTTLNGAPLASPVPDKKAVPLDVIPSSLIESIVTKKSYSVDQPGDYAGGLVALKTKKFPNRQMFSFSYGVGGSTTVTGEDGLTYAGGGTDFWGFEDGTRALPDAVPLDQPVRFGTFTRDQLQDIGRSFGGDWGPTLQSLGPNLSGGITYGNAWDVGGRELGLLASVTHSAEWSRNADVIERVFAVSGIDDPEVDYTGEVNTRNVNLGGLFNIAYELGLTHQVKFEGVYNRLVEDISRRLEGFNLDSNTDQRNFRIQYIQQELVNAQVSGEHLFEGFGDLGVDWRAAYTRAARYEPSTREVLYREFDGTFLYDDFIQSGSVFHQDMVDDGYSAGLDIEVPFEFRDEDASLKIGGSLQSKDRDTYTRRFRFRPVPGGDVNTEIRSRDPNDLFVEELINPNGFEIQEATFRTDIYDASEDIEAAYAMLDIRLASGVALNAGARYEQSEQVVTPRDLIDLGIDPVPGASLDKGNWLPGVNLTFEIADDQNIRAGFSRTLARPQLRELAPFQFADYAGGYLVIGNPLLELSDILNFDARWEWFFGPGQLIAVSGFYKEFTNPIEVLVLPSTELIRSWVNVGDATNYGTEIEFRSSLDVLSEALRDFSFNANVTLVESEVTQSGTARIFIPGQGEVELAVVERDRALQGQSPYVYNMGLTFAPLGGRTQASVLFNRFGRRIDAVGRQATPDIFEEARSSLDVTFRQDLGRGVNLKFSASRLIGNEVQYTQGGGLLRGWDTGRKFSLSFSWEAQ